MGIFGRKRRQAAGDEAGAGADIGDEPVTAASGAGEAEDVEGDPPADRVDGASGPYDEADAPDDGLPRMDLGSVRVPVPDGSQVQVEMDQQGGNVRAVHIVVPQGQVTVSAYAAPRSGGQWRSVSDELAEQLRGDGAKVSLGRGEWGMELSAVIGEMALRFVGVDGPRWMLRGVIAGPQTQAAEAPEVLRDIVRGTIVARGDAPMPVRTPLPVRLPEQVAQHIAAQQSGQG
ncbi:MULTISPECIES: DUF3710 domain-containing protein [Prauserella salsuginis group]|uniref:DUF3710 domain-containing protein n=1 Tax=Prauserella salsuginis TaxID=387889 RepID=A0ABW6G300_9PSEU|nr:MULTISPECIES: DUF3710 domain-containing protein [Prauserella salsuginis group]MCR3718418.1 Protein of unknown function (DUF3710) [Prauserella flava]MCR3732988.1 Protein of unknown function (DUF3710) [Prauserella salsuginis]